MCKAILGQDKRSRVEDIRPAAVERRENDLELMNQMRSKPNTSKGFVTFN